MASTQESDRYLHIYHGRIPLHWLVCLGQLLLFPAPRSLQPDRRSRHIQLFIALGGGVLVTSEQTTLMAVSKQQDFPALLACESMVISIGSAIGSTIAGAIWTGVFPARLTANLPADAMDNFAMIYGDLDTQTGYPWGSPARDAINLSYAQTQRYMLIAATCIYSITWASVFFWQDVDVRKMKQRTFGLL